MSGPTDIELRLHVTVLRRRIRRSGRTLRGLEDELGWVRGTLTALGRNPEMLRFDDLFEILAAIGVEPGDFFEEVAVASAKRARAPGRLQRLAGALLRRLWPRDS